MAARPDPSSSATWGFLTVVEDVQNALVGGYLALNAAGRPLEFHCTAPVKANRAQEILYGPTLAPYLYGELIGGTLLARAKTRPVAVCTDLPPTLAARETTDIPLVLVLSPEYAEPVDEPNGASPKSIAAAYEADRGAEGGSTAAVAPAVTRLRSFRLGANRLAVLADHEEDRRFLEQSCAEQLAEFDLTEPFARIREALEEAQRGAR